MIPKRVVGCSVILDIPNSEVFDNLAVEMATLVTNHRKKLILNLSNIEFTESTDLAILMVAYKIVGAHEGELAFFGMKPHGLRLLELSRLDQVLNIYISEQEAVDAFNGSSSVLSLVQSSSQTA